MKRTLLTLAFFFLLAGIANAANITFEWDNPNGQAWDNVRIYEDVAGNPLQVAEVPGSVTEATVTNVAPGTHTYFARSYMNGEESDNSNTVSQTIKPNVPDTFRVKVVVTVEVQ